MKQYLRQQIPKDELVTILDNIGLPNSGINLSYSNSGVIGTSDAEILVGLNAEHHHSTADYIRKLREDLPRQFPGVEFFFQPADIVTQILNFGLPAPIDIQVTGADMQGNYVIAQQIANRLRHVPGTADVHVQQMLDSADPASSDIDRNQDYPGRNECARRGPERAGLAERQLPDCAQLLAESQEWRDLPGGGAVAAVPHDVAAGPDEHAGEQSRRCRTRRC